MCRKKLLTVAELTEEAVPRHYITKNTTKLAYLSFKEFPLVFYVSNIISFSQISPAHSFSH